MARKRKWVRIEKSKKGKKKRMRVIVRNKPVFGVNSHELKRAKKRGDRQYIRHAHIYGSKRHIPLDLKYLWYVVSDAWKSLRRKLRKKKRNREKD